VNKPPDADQPETLAEALDVLFQRETELRDSVRQVADLRRELDDTNHGLIALYTELEKARHTEARLAAIVMSSDEAIISMTPQQIIRTWNPSAQRLFGHAESQVVGHSVEGLIPAESRGEFERNLDWVRSGGHPVPYDTRWTRRDGTLLDVSVTVSGMRGADDAIIGYSTMARDITDLLATQAELAAARADQEVMTERDRIARDLHDMVIQRVFGAGLALQSALGLIDVPGARARIETVINELDATIRELRGAIFDLHRPLRATTLSSRLHDLTNSAQRELGLALTVNLDGPIDSVVSDEIATHLLAVLREALSNITRHAQASSVEIVLKAGSDLMLQVSDNGRGLGPTTRSSGFSNMRERAHALGGTFEVTSEPGIGTRLHWRIPLQRPKSAV
jgi:PAS domain S-box-containing protein